MSFRTLLASLPLFASCASGVAWHNADALAADSLEISVDNTGRPHEIEYHMPPQAVPEVVHAAMNKLHPGGRAIAAEKEYEGGTLYWELAKSVDGFKIEAMFSPDGTLHSEEVEIPVAKVPQAVRDAVDAARWGKVTAWEEIHDDQRTLVEYHAKTTLEGRNYKLLLGTDGSFLKAFREMEAEIEVPVE